MIFPLKNESNIFAEIKLFILILNKFSFKIYISYYMYYYTCNKNVLYITFKIHKN